MEPIAAAALVVTFAGEFAKGIMSAAAQDTWKKIKERFGWSAEPTEDQIKTEVARRLQTDKQLADQLAPLLDEINKLRKESGGAPLVDSINNAKNVIVARDVGQINNT